jgi:type IV fimbrial biogenesis protein FimT
MRVIHVQGFTLIELLATIAMAAMVLTLGVPSFQNTIRDNRMAGHSNRFLGAVNLARSEAIKRGQQVTVCKVDAASEAAPACNNAPCDEQGGANCWEQGWVVFADAEPLGVIDEGQDTVIRVFEPLPKGLSLRVGDNDAHWIAYDSLGKGSGSGSSGMPNQPRQPDDTFRLCPGTDKEHARFIRINTLGRALVMKDKKEIEDCLTCVCP